MTNKWIRTSLFSMTFVLLASCAGSKAIRSTRQGYNDAIEKTSSEQLLLNLVRLRYRDPPSFMELSSLSTQFAFEKSIGFNATTFDKRPSRNVFGISGNLEGSERPTVTYIPLHGADFVKRLVTPIDEETIVLLARSGWRVDRLLPMTVQVFNGVENARSASGPTPEKMTFSDYRKFQKAVSDLQLLADHSVVTVGYVTYQSEISGGISTGKVEGADFIAAADKGWKLQLRRDRVSIPVEKIKSDSIEVDTYFDPELFASLVSETKEKKTIDPILVRFDKESGAFKIVEGHLRFRAAKGAELKFIPCDVELTGDHVLTASTKSLVMRWDENKIKEEDKYALRSLTGAVTLKSGEGRFDLEPRSLVGVMYYLSHAIQVPIEHEAAGLVTLTTDESGNPFDWSEVLRFGELGDPAHPPKYLINILSQEERPDCAAVAVCYRGYWFYIDDRDLESKSTFTLLSQLFELQAGGGAGAAAPVLTLPVGG